MCLDFYSVAFATSNFAMSNFNFSCTKVSPEIIYYWGFGGVSLELIAFSFA